MKKISLPAKIAIALTGLLWVFMILRVPTVDFDESLYRSVTESMKRSGNPWLLSWDQSPLYHKPPIFYWLIWAVSSIVDYGKENVSSLAARIPSVLSTTGILLSLYFGTGKKIAPVLAFLCALFPLITGAAVIFDPLQTLALMPALLIPLKLFQSDEELKIRHYLLMGASLGLASMIKGLNGLIIPGFAFGLHLLFQWKRFGWVQIFKIALRYFALTAVPGAVITAAFYTLLHQKIGPAFTQEFIWVQHFSRSSQAMEAHSGSWLYHPMVLFLGGGFLTPLCIYLSFEKRPNFFRFGYPLTFALSFVLIFSLSATKLPHYIWPAWPALALFVGLLSDLKTPSDEPRVLERRLGFLSSIPVFFLGVLFLLLATAPKVLFDSFPASDQVQILVGEMLPFSFTQRVCFYLGALSCFVFQVRRKEAARNLEVTAVFATIAALTLGVGITPTLKAILVNPFELIAESLKSKHPSAQDCIRYTGPLSATLSLALAPELIHNRCDANTAKYMITPKWKASACASSNFKLIDEKSYLLLCERN